MQYLSVPTDPYMMMQYFAVIMNPMMMQYLDVQWTSMMMQYFAFLIAALGDIMTVMRMYPYDMMF